MIKFFKKLFNKLFGIKTQIFNSKLSPEEEEELGPFEFKIIRCEKRDEAAALLSEPMIYRIERAWYYNKRKSDD